MKTEKNILKSILVAFIKIFGFFFSINRVARGGEEVQKIEDSQLSRIGLPQKKKLQKRPDSNYYYSSYTRASVHVHTRV